MIRSIVNAAVLLVSINCFAQSSSDTLFHEKYRPQYHFTPEKNWMNDPNGLVYFDGEYHLFYQHNPFGNVWGHMSWGHAVSRDLIHWEHLPVAIPEENGIMIFSGSAVVDSNNTSGFGKAGQIPLVAIYTGHTDTNQSQHIAYSLDKGRTWTKFEGNPVIDLHKKDFRDPKVFWYAPTKKWIMLVVFPQDHIIQFYSSADLKKWEHVSDFGPAGDATEIWECSDLSLVPVDGSQEKKWVLMNSQQLTVQYFVGDFDGTSFHHENNPGKIYRQDYGPDYYAVISYNDLLKDAKPVSIGWVNNWRYANQIPTSPWKSAMSLPREMTLRKVNNEWILYQQPVQKLNELKGKSWFEKNMKVTKSKRLPKHGRSFQLHLEWKPGKNGVSGARVAVGENKYVEVGFDPAANKVYTDRSAYADSSFSAAFAVMNRYEAEVKPENGVISMDIYFDHSVMEVYVNKGSTVLTMQVFSNEHNDAVELFAKNPVTFKTVQFVDIKSVWQ